VAVSQRLEKLLIDSSYQGAFTQVATYLGIVTEIAAKPETTQGFVSVQQRWVVEITFAWTNFFRRIAKDYEYTKESSQVIILLANSTITHNRLAA
jgi:transposase